MVDKVWPARTWLASVASQSLLNKVWPAKAWFTSCAICQALVNKLWAARAWLTKCGPPGLGFHSVTLGWQPSPSFMEVLGGAWAQFSLIPFALQFAPAFLITCFSTCIMCYPPAVLAPSRGQEVAMQQKKKKMMSHHLETASKCILAGTARPN